MISSASYDQDMSLTDDESGTNWNESGTNLQCLLITPILDQVQNQDSVESGV